MAADELHTFLFVDISGYSQLTEQNGDEAAANIAISFAQRVAQMAAEHGAEVVKWVGDGVMVRARCATDAIELGLRLHGTPGDTQALPPVHVGVHTGPAIQRAGDWWGATVNIASRVADAAEAGQLLITEATRHAAGRCPAQLNGLGSVQFRNISAPVSVYAARADDGIASLGYRNRPKAVGRRAFNPQPAAAQA
jgi:adenylate cyclase